MVLTGQGADIVIVAVGTASANQQSLDIIKIQKDKFYFCSGLSFART